MKKDILGIAASSGIAIASSRPMFYHKTSPSL
jgi:hypothetical protein